MSKAEGKKIAIKFTENLVGDVSGLNPPVSYGHGTLDLAQGKPVTVGNASYGAGTSAVDGNGSTYWGTYSTLPWWIRIDLGEVKKSAGFYILQSNSSYRAKDYVVLVSNDDADYVEISSGQLENIAEQTVPYKFGDYRYIRINFTSYWSSSRAYIYTLKILEAVPTGNEQAFIITGKEYQYVQGPNYNGPLLDKRYKPISVEKHPTIDKAILLSFPIRGEINNAIGDLTVSYDALVGNLSGRGGRVDNFEVDFTPVDLIATPNPGVTEIITVAPMEITADLVEVEYINRYTEEHLSVAPVEVTATLINIEDINP